MEIDYYEATSLDAKDIIEYLNVIASQTNNLTFGKNELEINELQEMQLINEIHNSINSVMILAKDGNKIVGMVSLSGESKARIKHRSNLGISVLKEYWHQGIGSSLLAAAIGYAIEKDIERILSDVIARVSKTAGLAVHIDTDEANAAGLTGTVDGEAIIG